MQNILKQKKQVYWKGLRVLAVVLLVIGVFFRMVNLDRKVYWYDEVYTSLRISGYTRTETVQQVFKGDIISIEDLQKYQRLNSEKGLGDTVKSLALEDPHHPPLYYVMVRFWVQMFGNSVAVTRSLSAFISLLVFPCLYWLCLELFESSPVGWVAIALVAVSPFHVLYAQEAREYSLWTVTILLASAALLQAMRLKTQLSWVTYTATLVLGLYSHLFFGFVAISHGIYLVTLEGFRRSKTVIAYLLASVTGLLIFAPWILVINNNLNKFSQETSWHGDKKIAFLSLFKTLIGNISRLFIDFDIGARSFAINTYLIPLSVLVLLIVSLNIYAIVFLFGQTQKRVWLFILTLIGVTAVALLLPDLIFGGRRSSVSRYLIPCYLGIQLAVAYLLTTQITGIHVKTLRSQKLWRLVTLIVFLTEVISCTISSPANTWWNKYFNYSNPQVAHIINKTAQPLLISDNRDVGGVLSLSYLLDPKVRIQFVSEPNKLQIPDGFSDMFMIYPSEQMQQSLLQQKYKIEPVIQASEFWVIKK